MAIVTQETVLFDDTIAANIAIRPARRHAGRDRERRHVPPMPHEFIKTLDGGIPDDDRRARTAAVWRAAAAHRDRARDPEGLTDPDPRRGHVVARRRVRDAGAGRAVDADAQPHVVRHRASTLHGAPGRRDRRARARPHRRGRHATTSCSRGAARMRNSTNCSCRKSLPRSRSASETGLSDDDDQIDDRIRLADARGRARDDRRDDQDRQSPVPRHPAPHARSRSPKLESRVRALLQTPAVARARRAADFRAAARDRRRRRWS